EVELQSKQAVRDRHAGQRLCRKSGPAGGNVKQSEIHVEAAAGRAAILLELALIGKRGAQRSLGDGQGGHPEHCDRGNGCKKRDSSHSLFPFTPWRLFKCSIVRTTSSMLPTCTSSPEETDRD